MSFPLGSLSKDAVPRDGVAEFSAPRWRLQFAVVFGGVLWLLALLALATHSGNDPAWSTSGMADEMHNRAGVLGAWFADIAFFLFGYSVWWALLIAGRAWLSALARLLRAEDTPARSDVVAARPAWLFWLGLVLVLAASCSLEWTRLYQWESRLPGGHGGGVLGYALGGLSMKAIGFTGSGVFWIAALVLGLPLALRFSWSAVAEQLGSVLEGLREKRQERIERAEDIRLGEQAMREREHVVEIEREQLDDHAPLLIEPTVIELPRSERVAKEKQKPLFTELADTKLPQVDLLDAVPGRMETMTPESLEMTSRLIEKKLKDFGVEVRVVAASPGPVITRYEIEPATGVKGSQIVNLAKDLARSLSLVSIRVVETIPGKNYMALELPNAKRQTIRLSEILGSQAYNDASSMLTMGMGKDIVGGPVVADLAKMPHVLVAGTTGSGKSVGINAMILSLLYKAEARDVRLIMIDPKMLEMSVYEGIPHLLCPVVTDMKQAANALNWGVGEMERRYKLMSKLGVRNLAGYNKKIDEASTKGEKLPNPFSLTPEAPEPLERLPHVVIVIDELADLMMVIGKKIEELIARLAQKARAAGIHLILATQRPSVDVITGLIKANIPTRIAFQVSSKIDSRTILDQMGAEALLGMGDMLYMPSGTGLPIRVHGAFVSDEEVHRVADYLRSQGQPNYIEGILEGGTLDDESGAGGEGGGTSDGEADPMYDQAVGIVLQHKRASISLVQRHLRIGYNRAARLLEQMEKSGLVSSMATNGNRDLLVPVRNAE
ncbi:DNA translocase FtsK [Methylibium petroleiphilum]|uniref:DNA translocase FtsK n=1 Tax=Methylibium petroleiphilum (strain ATCC BAA-1232 / LMG 22953 / PM1) TaxID=420662 RepID=A2SEU2_METPP|nr:DNA translocase FtsK [Methylibium petroleiphilum]ABM94081.1 DNA translocase FtsK [Methylibium petroleiphilum PM1]